MNVQIARQLVLASNLFNSDQDLAWQLYETALDLIDCVGSRSAVQAALIEQI